MKIQHKPVVTLGFLSHRNFLLVVLQSTDTQPLPVVSNSTQSFDSLLDCIERKLC